MLDRQLDGGVVSQEARRNAIASPPQSRSQELDVDKLRVTPNPEAHNRLPQRPDRPSVRSETCLPVRIQRCGGRSL